MIHFSLKTKSSRNTRKSRFVNIVTCSYKCVKPLGWLTMFYEKSHFVRNLLHKNDIKNCHHFPIAVANTNHLRCVNYLNKYRNNMLTNWFCIEIDVNASGNRIGDDQQRRGQIVGPRVRMNTAFKISVAGQYSTANQVVLECSIRYGEKKNLS